MRVIRGVQGLADCWRGGAVAIGNFDGVHRGHARIIDRLRELARRVGGPAVVFTFDPHPVRLLRPEAAPPPLTWTERKSELLAGLGVNALIVYPTDESLLQLSPPDFFQRIIRDALHARGVVEGPNFRFGRDRAGDIHTLRGFCQQADVELEIVEPLVMDAEIVSSSRVRECIARGDVEQARRLLTEPYRIRGLVTHGSSRGARIGFPTANLDAVDTIVPALGVYAGQALGGDGQRWRAAIHLGPNPTFGDATRKIEVHLIGFAGSLYGQPLEVDFRRRLRDIRPFASVAELQAQLRLDVASAESDSPL